MKFSKVCLTIVAFCLTAAPGWTHDLKVIADRAAVARGETVKVSISWGHELPQDSPIEADAIERYELYAPTGQTHQLKTSGLSQHVNEQSLSEAGVYRAVAVKKPSIFTVLRDAEGKHRHHRGSKTTVQQGDGDIEYAALSRQFAKSLITSGERDNQLVPIQGLPLEIVPLETPDQWNTRRELHFQVLFDGQPVAQEEVVLSVIGLQPTTDAKGDTDVDKDGFTNPTLTTDENGVVTVAAVPSGTWVLRQRVKKPVTDEKLKLEYDFESFTSTLMLEVQP